MRFERRGPERETTLELPLLRPSESLSIIDGPTRQTLIDLFNGMTKRERKTRDFLDGVLRLSGTRISYVRPADLRTGIADDRLGTLQVDITGVFAPETVRNMRFMICSPRLAELGKEDWACLLDGEFGGRPLPGRFFDPKPILPDAVSHVERAMVLHDALTEMYRTGESKSGTY